MGVIGVEHFEYLDFEQGLEQVFRPSGNLEGVDLAAAGLPAAVWEWLNGEPIEEVVVLSATVFEAREG